MGPGPLQLGKYSPVMVRFGKNSKEYELQKLRNVTLNQRFIQTFVNYYPFSDLIFLEFVHYTFNFVLKSFHLGSLQQMGIFGPLLGKKDTIWHWDWVLITDPNSLEKNPCALILYRKFSTS